MSAKGADYKCERKYESNSKIFSFQVKWDTDIHHHICQDHLTRHFERYHLEEKRIVLRIPSKHPYIEEIDTDPKEDVLHQPVSGNQDGLFYSGHTQKYMSYPVYPSAAFYNIQYISV